MTQFKVESFVQVEQENYNYTLYAQIMFHKSRRDLDT